MHRGDLGKQDETTGWFQRHFPCPPWDSGPRNTGNPVQTQGNAPEVPKRAT
jgi:hypothetical protein